MPDMEAAKKYHIVVSGYYGSRNAGDEAMLASMIEVLTQKDIFGKAVEITVISADPADTVKRHGVKAISWLAVPKIVGALRQADLLLSGGGSLLQNVTSKRSLYYYLGVISLAEILGTPVMLYAQGIGPVYGEAARLLMRTVLRRVKAITVRDASSAEELKELGIQVPATVTADPVLALAPVGKEQGRNLLLASGVLMKKPLFGIAVRAWLDRQAYKKEIAAAVHRAAEEFGVEPVFLPMQYPEDMRTAEEIVALLPKDCPAIVMKGEYSTAELLSIVGNFSLLLSVRLHALIFAAIMGVPMSGISYDPKIERFLHSLGDVPCGSLEYSKAEQIFDDLARKWHSREAFQEKTAARLAELRRLSLENIRVLTEVFFRQA